MHEKFHQVLPGFTRFRDFPENSASFLKISAGSKGFYEVLADYCDTITDTQESTNYFHSMKKLKRSSNYETWAIKTQIILIKKGLWDAIKPDNNLTSPGTTTSITKSTNGLTFAIIDKTFNQQAVTTIILSLDNSLIDHVIGISLAKSYGRLSKIFLAYKVSRRVTYYTKI